MVTAVATSSEGVPPAAPSPVIPRVSRVLLLGLVVSSLWLSCRLLVLRSTGIPPPRFHDEFSYLLGADTFARGRLANPPHAFPEFFESPHVLLRPTYASKYPPGQALVLALGQRFFGSPFYGVILGDVLMMFTMTLMLLVWVPVPSALGTAVMLGCSLMPPMYWTNSYYGGALPASGGALILVAVRYGRGRQSAAVGMVFALGAVVLLSTRPFEGGVLTITVLAVFAKDLWSQRRAAVLLAALPVFALAFGFAAQVNKAATGRALSFPYKLYDTQYDTVPRFWILPLRPEPPYSHPRLAAHGGAHGWDREFYDDEQPWIRGLYVGFTTAVRSLLFAVTTYGQVQLVGCMALALIAMVLPPYRAIGMVTITCIVAFTFETWHFPHYAAPALAPFLILLAAGAARFWNFSPRDVPVGALLPVLLLAFSVAAALTGPRSPFVQPWALEREALIGRLTSLKVPQVIFVRYPSPRWKPEEEWVYNGADIDMQPVVFAHDLGPEEDAKLVAYFGNRQASFLAVNEAGYALTPCSPNGTNPFPKH